jgi:uncharacterized coiled-coil protein SlyX
MSSDLKEKLFWARAECECALANLKTTITAVNEQLSNLRLIRSQLRSTLRMIKEIEQQTAIEAAEKGVDK